MKLESSQNLPMPIVWLLLEVPKTSTGSHSFWTSENSSLVDLNSLCLVSNGWKLP